MNNCKYCKADCVLRGEENLKECKGNIPMTNADRIRSMSDEELAKILGDKCICPPIRKCAKTIGECDACWLKWFQQPAEPPKEDA